MTPNLTACHRNYPTSHFLAELDIEILLSNFYFKRLFSKFEDFDDMLFNVIVSKN